MIQTPKTAAPRCTATVKLLSRYFRPYLFEVVVVGEPPHPYRVTYKIAAPDDDSAAFKGMQLFVREFLPWVAKQQMLDIAPKAKLQ
jgi:hypothetical protein